MKKLLLFAAVLALPFVSCSSSDKEDEPQSLVDAIIGIEFPVKQAVQTATPGQTPEMSMEDGFVRFKKEDAGHIRMEYYIEEERNSPVIDHTIIPNESLSGTTSEVRIKLSEESVFVIYDTNFVVKSLDITVKPSEKKVTGRYILFYESKNETTVYAFM